MDKIYLLYLRIRWLFTNDVACIAGNEIRRSLSAFDIPDNAGFGLQIDEVFQEEIKVEWLFSSNLIFHSDQVWRKKKLSDINYARLN